MTPRQAQREVFIAESKKRLRELWGLTKDQADIAEAMLRDAMAFADAHREGQEDAPRDRQPLETMDAYASYLLRFIAERHP